MGATPTEPTMSLWDHLRELRYRLIMSLAGVFVGMVIAWFLRKMILSMLMRPLQVLLPDYPGLTVLSLTEAFIFYIKISLFGGVVIASPWVFWHIWRFVAPGLYTHEKRAFLGIALFTVVCFLGGAYFGYRVLIPFMFRFLIGISQDFQLMITTTSYLTFFMQLIVGVGLIFEMPVFALILARLGIITARTLGRFWKFAIVGSFILAAVITPSGDIVTQTVLAVPLIALYLISILVAWIFGRRPAPVSEATGEPTA